MCVCVNIKKLPATNIAPEKRWLTNCFPFRKDWEGLFSGFQGLLLLVLGRVYLDKDGKTEYQDSSHQEDDFNYMFTIGDPNPNLYFPLASWEENHIPIAS